MVEFRMVNEKRWLLMKKVAFYIVERPVIQNNDNGEFKETNSDHDNLAPVEVMTRFNSPTGILDLTNFLFF